MIEGRRVSEKEYRNRVAAGERGFVIPKLVGGGCGLSKEKGGNAGSVVAPQEEEDEQRPMDTKEIVVSGNGQASVQSSAVVNEQKPAAAVPQAKGESISMDTGNVRCNLFERECVFADDPVERRFSPIHPNLHNLNFHMKNSNPTFPTGCRPASSDLAAACRLENRRFSVCARLSHGFAWICVFGNEKGKRCCNVYFVQF